MDKNNELRASDRLEIGRRDFLVKTAAVGVALSLGSMTWSSSTSASAATQQTGSIMTTRKLGTIEVSELGAGAMGISANYGPRLPTRHKVSARCAAPTTRA